MGPTGANRAYSFAGTSVGFVSDPQPPSGGLPNLTIFDLLDQAGISWRYYYQNAAPEWITVWSVYNTDSNKVVPMSSYFDDIKNDATLPQVVFIEENGNLDEHPKPNPGTNSSGQNIQNGAKNMSSIIGALMASPSWKSSVFILAYDEGGGMHDHVIPANMTQPDGYAPAIASTDQPGIFNQAGFRVPFVVVSPWTVPHLVSHLNRDHTSFLKLIETRFSLPPLTARDDAADNMTEFFNFQSPSWMTPPTLPVQPTNGVCDLTLEKAPGQ
jgi:phospholipase C